MIHIRNGLYEHGYEPHDMPGAWIGLQFQVYYADGRPARLTYDGPGEFALYERGTAGRKVLILGHAYSVDLERLEVDDAPTAESEEYDAAYRAGWKARRQMTAREQERWTANRRDAWWDGWRDRPQAKRKRNPSPLEVLRTIQEGDRFTARMDGSVPLDFECVGVSTDRVVARSVRGLRAVFNTKGHPGEDSSPSTVYYRGGTWPDQVLPVQDITITRRA